MKGRWGAYLHALYGLQVTADVHLVREEQDGLKEGVRWEKAGSLRSRQSLDDVG